MKKIQMQRACAAWGQDKVREFASHRSCYTELPGALTPRVTVIQARALRNRWVTLQAPGGPADIWSQSFIQDLHLAYSLLTLLPLVALCELILLLWEPVWKALLASLLDASPRSHLPLANCHHSLSSHFLSQNTCTWEWMLFTTFQIISFPFVYMEDKTCIWLVFPLKHVTLLYLGICFPGIIFFPSLNYLFHLPSLVHFSDLVIHWPIYPQCFGLGFVIWKEIWLIFFFF